MTISPGLSFLLIALYIYYLIYLHRCFEGHIPLLKKCLLITELSQQRFIWAYAKIQYKQPKWHYDWSLINNRNITNKYMKTLRNKFDALQEISETLQMTNVRTSLTLTWKQNAYQPNQKSQTVPWETLAVTKKKNQTWKRYPYVIKGTQLIPTLRN